MTTKANLTSSTTRAEPIDVAMKERGKEMMDYSSWSQESLIQKIKQLEQERQATGDQLKIDATLSKETKKSWKRPRAERPFDASKYSTRPIALKLAYLGKRYIGFEHHVGNKTPLPAVEEEIWKALMKARLIAPTEIPNGVPGEVNWEGCSYSKCGRTDKGVSAFGQVIGVTVRSNRPSQTKKSNALDGMKDNVAFEEATQDTQASDESAGRIDASAVQSRSQKAFQESKLSESEELPEFDPILDELPYPTILNRLLPSDIRILAWCPSPLVDFSARHSCRERQYRYFFTQPAFNPTPHQLEHPGISATDLKDGWLDIEAMRTAARFYEGLHDFRNFCKVDPSKQNFNYKRKIFYSNIEEINDHTGAISHVNTKAFLPGSSTEMVGGHCPKVYTFTLHGSAFLWHQVRHMVAVLFLVGQGLEPPSIVQELLDVEKNPCRPTYEMATDTPLVLWDCIFPDDSDEERKDAMQWIYVGDGPKDGPDKYSTMGLMEDLWKTWRERKIDEMLAGTLIDVVSRQGKPAEELSGGERKGVKSQRVFDGGDMPRLQGVYLPVMKKPRMDTVEAINEKYAIRKGFESSAAMKEKKAQDYREK